MLQGEFAMDDNIVRDYVGDGQPLTLRMEDV